MHNTEKKAVIRFGLTLHKGPDANLNQRLFLIESDLHQFLFLIERDLNRLLFLTESDLNRLLFLTESLSCSSQSLTDSDSQVSSPLWVARIFIWQTPSKLCCFLSKLEAQNKLAAATAGRFPDTTLLLVQK